MPSGDAMSRALEAEQESQRLKKVKTPECEKLARVSRESNAIGGFMDWLVEKKLFLCRHEEGRNYPQVVNLNMEELLAEFYDIDLKKVEKERRALLRALKAA